MRSLTLLSLASATLAYSDFRLPYVNTHQPSGVADGQVNYYHIQFNITSANAIPSHSESCGVFWGDNGGNCGNNCVPYSTGVITEWTGCTTNLSEAISDRNGAFSFKLFPYFSIGNFTIALREKIADADGAVTTLESSPYQITNSSTAVYNCTIRGSETSVLSHVGQHATGDCTTPEGTEGFSIPVKSAT